jgi:predicted transcriptional regulator of viral defense system
MDWSKVIASESKTRAIIQTDDYAKRHKLSIRSVHAGLKRQGKKGLIERVSNKIYINKLAKGFSQRDLLHVLRRDSYVSLESALADYGITSQVRSAAALFQLIDRSCAIDFEHFNRGAFDVI